MKKSTDITKDTNAHILQGKGTNNSSNRQGIPNINGELVLDKLFEDLTFDDTMCQEADKTDSPAINSDNIEDEDMLSLPIWGLPENLQDVIREVAAGYQCHRDYCTASLFAATSAALCKRLSATFNNYSNYGSMFMAIVGGTSSGKTEPIKWFFRPITDKERTAYDHYRQELKEWLSRDEKERGEKPTYRHVLINNPTDESVLFELGVNGSVTWLADELVTIFESWGRYAKGGNSIVSNLLSIFNNQDVQITRKTEDPTYLREPNLTIFGGVQPEILRRLMNKGYRDNGLFQRFLFVYPDEQPVPLYNQASISRESKETWRLTIERMEHTEPVTLTETSEAERLHISTINRWREMLNNEYKDIDAMKALVRKLEIYLCRWSILVAALHGANEIDEDNIRYTSKCMEYFRLCGEKTFCLLSSADDERREPTKSEVLKSLERLYPNLNQSQLGEALGISQQAVNKLLRKKD